MQDDDPPVPSQNMSEFAILLDLYCVRQPNNTLEIGTHEGGTLYYWLRHAKPGAKVASIDNQRIQPERYSEWPAPGVKFNYKTCPSESQEAWQFACNFFEYIDWLFIDGGHKYIDVWRDFHTYKELMTQGGVIAFHDICSYPPYNSDVDFLWAELKRKHNALEIIEKQEDGFGHGPGIGVLFL